MNCREFQEKHCAFVDDTLPGVELVRMQQHLCECRCCAEHDTKVRKSLMLLRSLPYIEPSCNFQDRLKSRLKNQKPLPPYSASYGHLYVRKGVVVTAGVMLAAAAILAYVVVSPSRLQKPQDIILPPVVASIPEVTKSPIALEAPESPEQELSPVETPSMEVFATASAGVPGVAIWPTAILAEQTPEHVINSPPPPSPPSPRPVVLPLPSLMQGNNGNNGITPVGLGFRQYP